MKLDLLNHTYSKMTPVRMTSRSNVYTGKWWSHSTDKEEEDVSELLALPEASCVTFGNHPNCVSIFSSEKNNGHAGSCEVLAKYLAQNISQVACCFTISQCSPLL